MSIAWKIYSGKFFDISKQYKLIIQQHPPSPGTNKSYLFKREPPDGAEVIKPICDSNKPSMIDSIEKPSFVRPENTFKPR